MPLFKIRRTGQLGFFSDKARPSADMYNDKFYYFLSIPCNLIKFFFTFALKWFLLKNTIILFLLVSQIALSQSVRKYSNEFLNIGVGAEAFGKGNAHIAGVQDVTAGYWNPSQLVYLENNLKIKSVTETFLFQQSF